MELAIDNDNIRLDIHHNRRARRYLLRIRPDGTVRVTIPRYGTREEAMRFVVRQRNWIIRNRERTLARIRVVAPLVDGSLLWFRGEKVPLKVSDNGSTHVLCYGGQQLSSALAKSDWRPVIDTHLRRLATQEFPELVQRLGRQCACEVKRITIRDQKSRWGSCSARKTISLNWRLIQAPTFVLEYVIVHELMHLREMNHSTRFWNHVAAVFPQYREAEQWLREFGPELR